MKSIRERQNEEKGSCQTQKYRDYSHDLNSLDVLPVDLLNVHDLEKYRVEDESLNQNQKKEEKLVISGTYTIPNPWTMMVVHHHT